MAAAIEVRVRARVAWWLHPALDALAWAARRRLIEPARAVRCARWLAQHSLRVQVGKRAPWRRRLLYELRWL